MVKYMVMWTRGDYRRIQEIFAGQREEVDVDFRGGDIVELLKPNVFKVIWNIGIRLLSASP